MRLTLTETNPRINNDLTAFNPKATKYRNLLFQKVINIQQNVIVLWIILHRLRIPQRVHDTDGRTTLCT